MPDITMCKGEGCSRKLDCYRYTADPDLYWQSWFVYSGGDDCNNFMDNKGFRTLYLVWNCEHNGWWNKDLYGYTKDLSKAERFPRYVAEGIVANGNVLLTKEVMVLEGEDWGQSHQDDECNQESSPKNSNQ